MSRAVLIAALAGCYNPSFAPGAPCETSQDCPRALECIANVCGGTLPHDPNTDASVDGTLPVDATIDAPPNVVTIVLGDDIEEIRDAFLWGANPNINYSSENHMAVDVGEAGALWFDLTAIPTTSTVVAATLSLHVWDEADETGGLVGAFRIREEWTENGATWLARKVSTGWTTSGARPPSSDPAPVATFAPAAVSTTYDIALPASLVQEWVATPEENYGVVLHPVSTAGHVHIATREGVVPPRLVVQYY